jgi:hypothetical protein
MRPAPGGVRTFIVGVGSFISSSTPLLEPPTARQRSGVPWMVKRVSFVPVGTSSNGPPALRCMKVPFEPTTHTSSPVPHTLKKPGSSPVAVRGRSRGSFSAVNWPPW